MSARVIGRVLPAMFTEGVNELTARTSDGFKLYPSPQTTGNIINVSNADSLSTGSIAKFISDSSSTSARVLVRIVNDNASATAATLLRLENDSSSASLDIRQNGNGTSLQIIHSGGSAPAINISTANQTVGNIISIANANSLSTGAIFSGLSNSTSSSSRTLVDIQNNSGAASACVALAVSQASSHTGAIVTHTGDAGVALSLNRTANSVVSQAAFLVSASNSGGAIYGIDLTGVTSNNAILKVNSTPISSAGAVKEQFKYVNSNGDVYYLVGYAAGT